MGLDGPTRRGSRGGGGRGRGGARTSARAPRGGVLAAFPEEVLEPALAPDPALPLEPVRPFAVRRPGPEPEPEPDCRQRRAVAVDEGELVAELLVGDGYQALGHRGGAGMGQGEVQETP